MKRTISLCLGMLAMTLIPALAQAPDTTGGKAAPAQTPSVTTGGKIHGTVTNPTGAPQSGGTIQLIATTRLASGPGLAAQQSAVAAFNVDTNGQYGGPVPAGIYTVVYRTPGMAPDKQADKLDNVKVSTGQDTVADIDMSRKEYIDTLSPETKKQLEELRKHNSEAMKANEIIKGINKDLATVSQDLKDIDGAHDAAVAQAGAGAAKADIDAKELEIKTAKYTDIATLMTKDSGARPDASVLWANLGQADAGLKKDDDAEAAFKKVLELEATSKKPSPSAQGAANAGLGEIYARNGKVPEANAAYDAAAKANPPSAATYLKNEAVIFSHVGNADAQAAAADEAIKADPNMPVAYYLKASALVQKTTQDEKTKKLIAPPGCIEAYQKYLELAPTGTYANEVKGVLAGFDQKITSTYKAPKK